MADLGKARATSAGLLPTSSYHFSLSLQSRTECKTLTHLFEDPTRIYKARLGKIHQPYTGLKLSQLSSCSSFLHKRVSQAAVIGPSHSTCIMKLASSQPVCSRPQPPSILSHSTPLLQFSFRVDLHCLSCSVFALHNTPGFSFTFHHQLSDGESHLMQHDVDQTLHPARAGVW